jgi:hypothetical protein
MRIVGAYQPQDQSHIEEAVQKQACGRFYEFTRHYAVNDETDNRVYHITLNFFERIQKTFIELFGGNYFQKQSPFVGKKISLLTSTEAGLPVRPGQSPQPRRRSSTQQLSDDDTHRIITRFLIAHSASAQTPLATIRHYGDEILRCINEKVSEAYQHAKNMGEHEGLVDLTDLRRRPGCEEVDLPTMQTALNYLLLTKKMGYYMPTRGTLFKVSLDSEQTSEARTLEGEGQSRNIQTRERLMALDSYMAAHARTVADLQPIDANLLEADGQPKARLGELLEAINGAFVAEGTNPSVRTVIGTPYDFPYCDFLLKKGVITGYALTRSYISFQLTTSVQLEGEGRWRTIDDIQREESFRQANRVTVEAPRDWASEDTEMLRTCVKELNKRVKHGPCSISFDLSRGLRIAKYLKEQGKIVDYTNDFRGNFSFYVKEEDRPA